MQISYSICAEIQKEGILWGKRVVIGKILRMLCEWKKAEIVEAEVCKDHVHMLVKIPPKIVVSSFRKGKVA